MTYALLSLAVLIAVFSVTFATLRRLAVAPLLWTAASLVALTLVFDNIIVGVGLVAYDDGLILGIRLPIAPVEDLAYTLAAVMLVPAVWTWLGKRDAGQPRSEAA